MQIAVREHVNLKKDRPKDSITKRRAMLQKFHLKVQRKR